MDQYKQGILDRFTRTDELMLQMLPILERLQTGDITIQMPEGENDVLGKLFDLQEKRYLDDSEIIYFTYPNDGTRSTITAGDTILDYRAGTVKAADGNVTKMSSSLTDQKKEFLRSMAIVADKKIVIQLDAHDKSPVRADVLTGYTYNQFEKLIITATENTNVAVFACTNPKHSYVYSAESTISVGREERNQASTDKDSHFTGAIITDGIEYENISGLDSNEITITGISIQADENLDFRLWIFETDAHADTDLDVDEFVEFVDLDLTTNGARIAGAGQYYYAATDLNIDYEDIDASKELHIGLQNLSAAAKTAGAAGEVRVKCSYIPRT